MSERLTPEEVERLRVRSRESIGDIPVTWSELHCLLQAYDLMERLRGLQAEDVTEERRMEWMGEQWGEYPDYNEHRGMIAAAVRVMLADHFVDANKKDDTHAGT